MQETETACRFCPHSHYDAHPLSHLPGCDLLRELRCGGIVDGGRVQRLQGGEGGAVQVRGCTEDREGEKGGKYRGSGAEHRGVQGGQRSGYIRGASTGVQGQSIGGCREASGRDI